MGKIKAMNYAEFKKLKASISILEAASAAGNPVSDELEKLKMQLAAAPRGDWLRFLGLYLWFSMTLVLALSILQVVQDFLRWRWGYPDNPSVQHFHPLAAGLWKLIQELTSSTWVAPIPGLVLAGLWLIQSRLVRWQARKLLFLSWLAESAILLLTIYILFWLSLCLHLNMMFER